MHSDHLKTNWVTVNRLIRTAERNANRPANSVNLVAVSKLHSADSIRALRGLGQSAFAENFVQEALQKQNSLSDLDLEWHFIGRIQSNKTRDIASNFSWVHSVSQFKIARRLSDQRNPELPSLNICIQVNLQEEDSKSGASIDETHSLVDQMSNLPNITVRGLMIIPKLTEVIEEQRRVFGQLRELQDTINNRGYKLDTLSMGMTGDLESAIAEGATHVRIGTALFGPRPQRTG